MRKASTGRDGKQDYMEWGPLTMEFGPPVEVGQTVKIQGEGVRVTGTESVGLRYWNNPATGGLEKMASERHNRTPRGGDRK